MTIHTFIVFDSTSAFCSSFDNVVELTTSNFERKVLKDNAIWVVNFYTLQCRYCWELSFEIKKLAKKQKGVLKVGAIDVLVQKELKAKYGLRSIPKIKIFGKNKRSPIDYQGGLTAEAIAKAALAEAKKKKRTRS